MAIPIILRFWLLLIFMIPSILSSIFCLYYFLVDRTLRKALNNHVIIFILFLCLLYNITDIIWLIHYFRTSSSLSSTRIFCLIWVYSDYASYVSISCLTAWASVERHILIFHQNLIATQTKRFLFHYLPLIIFSAYPFIYYIVIFFILPCKTVPDYTMPRCGLVNCVYENASIGLWDGLANNIIPSFIIVIFSLALIGRVWYNKYRMGRRFQWRNYKKLTVQLLSISVLYSAFLFPPMLLYTAYSAGLSYDVGAEFYSSSLFFSYFVTLLIPCVCIVSLPELRTKLYKVTRMYRRAIPVISMRMLPISRLGDGRTARVAPALS
ncbi:unnamed protein product [Adineta steineri]|uniref:Uncharacterized protein n=1 Tax=Adineta steineri TaxID=433720 RepID=A0A813RIU9_9BILA|nr:unnamed protein product [Adineta steineri]